MLGSLAMREPRPKAKQGAQSSQQEVPLTLIIPKSIICTYIDKYTVVTQKKNKYLGKPWETQVTMCSIPRHQERAEAVTRFRLTTGHYFLGVTHHCLGLNADEVCPCSAALPESMVTICSNTLSSMNIRLMTSPVVTGRLDGKWPRS
ncbi:uncharacterized protein TNCV_2330111 [Trichonephila clavipes]|nr:uncharacterized protein TNCV_2330111 [Trichonephila clavipes]